jgi:serine protease Do
VNSRFAPPGARALAQGSGSGFIVSTDGYILTNNHVVADAQKVTVGLTDRRVFEARVIGRDPTTDVAVIKIEGANFPTLALGDDDNVRVGEWVLAVGNPLGLDFTVTSGIVSAKGRSMPGLLPTEYAISDFIQTDAAINPGNSGGPLVNIRGQVIGINSAIASPTGYNAGYGFAIPVTLAQSVMRDLIAYGEVRRGLLGLTLRDVDAPTAARLGLKTIAGALVMNYSGSDSPARAAGVQPEDVIVRVDGRPVDRLGTLQRVVRTRKPGDVVALGVVRGGEELTLRVRLASAPVPSRVASND